MKKKTKIIIAGMTITAIAAAVGGTVILTSATNKVEESAPTPNTVTVERMDLANKVSLSGTVKSADIATVKCSLNDIKVKQVNVKVGDDVKKGDVIAVLDDTDLQKKLEDAEKAYENTKTKNGIEVSAADRNKESTLSASDKSLKDADKSIQNAQKEYDEALEENNKIYKEYNEALEKKNKAYDKFKPFEGKDKSKDDGEEKEKEYNRAVEKVAQKEAELSAASEKLSQKEAMLREATGKFEAARNEITKLAELKQEAEAKLAQARAAAAASDDEEVSSADAGSDIAAVISSYNTSISAATKILKESEVVVKDAQKAFDTASSEYNKVSSEYMKATDEKKKAYDNYKDFLGKLDTEEGKEKEKDYNEAKEKFEKKEEELKDSNKKLDKARDELNKQKELKDEAAAKSVKDRKDLEGTYETTMMNIDEGVEKLENDIKTIKEDIEKCTIVATGDGVITSLNVKEGENFNGGEVAVIQNDKDFIISANADQYEIADIEKGMLTRITVNAVGSENQMEGTLSFAAPTPETKESREGSSIEYPVESEINDPVPGIRLGMNAKLEIISEEKLGVLAVPDECIQINENGDYYVETVDETGEINQITVNYGMKSDYYSEIEGSGITEGMQVVMPEAEPDMNFDDMILF